MAAEGRDPRDSSLEQALRQGIYGPREIKKEEKNLFLGQYRERVLKALTFAQIAEKGTYPAVRQAIRDPRARRLIVSSEADLEAARDYIRLAARCQLAFTTTSSPDLKGDIGLVVAAGEAVDEEEILVPNRRTELQSKGIPDALIDAAGEKVCPACYRLLREKAPGEAAHYRRAGILDRLLGVPCPACPPGGKGRSPKAQKDNK